MVINPCFHGNSDSALIQALMQWISPGFPNKTRDCVYIDVDVVDQFTAWREVLWRAAGSGFQHYCGS